MISNRQAWTGSPACARRKSRPWRKIMGRCGSRCSTSGILPKSALPTFRASGCRNRDLAAERARKREALLVATERELARIQAQVRRKGAAVEIGLAVGEVVNAKKMAKHFALD